MFSFCWILFFTSAAVKGLKISLIASTVAQRRQFHLTAKKAEADSFPIHSDSTNDIVLNRRQHLLLLASLVTVLHSRPVIATTEYNEAIYKILRVQEATQQEERLVRSGKFKDLQRSNIKFAITIILKNYSFLDSVNSASILSANSFDASQAGRDAVEALQAVLEYFDSSSTSLKVETLSGDKLDFVLKALQTCNNAIERLLSYLPDDLIAQAKRVIAEENRLNYEEYKQANPGEAYLNPNP
eukprot:CAMPEP_0197315530 /NCGR_PEP_ID=MMETSP0891-20130614/38643_1 /TAXON_ID=44058 ORGANISM="Aureoumbra lagunensis, Strain CCMP1510" /NCGR_SAMPLE_ID=MMETSP0891 /ASSEMBLY_ACC=CAM_ASM_000534 /LENGTH=241 /DNA_ID=CAMNT_0042804525 /DNA_START=74 /DNA_END=795 /DNA_ORIENTATION=+